MEGKIGDLRRGLEKADRDRDDLKRSLIEKQNEVDKAVRERASIATSLQLLQESRSHNGEQLLTELHDLISDVTKDIDMTEDQELEYQRVMGALDEAFKTVNSQKADLDRRLAYSDRLREQSESRTEDLDVKVKLLEEQCTLLRDRAKEEADKQKDLKVVKSEEFEKIEKELTHKEEIIIGQKNEVSKALARAKDSEDELAEIKVKYNRQEEELRSLAKTLADRNEATKLLENKYRHVKEKYAELREGNIKKYETRYNAKVKELEAKMAAQIEALKTTDETAKEKEDKIAEPEKVSDEAAESDRLRAEVSELRQQIEIMKRETDELQEDKRVKDDQINELEHQVLELQKRKNKFDDIDPKKPVQDISPEKAAHVDLNPKRILKFLEGIDVSTRTLYKDFIIYGSSHTTHDPKVDEMQLRMNKLVEQANDLKDYVEAKLSSLAK